MRLTLGPVQYYWPRDRLESFYAEVAYWPVEVVYLGETVCSKRRLFRLDDWLALATRLRDAGKEVVLSTLALIEAESELKTLRRICSTGDFLVEANDMAAVELLSAAGRPFVAGPTINIYNAETLRVLAAAGLMRWVPPMELDRDTIAAIQHEAPPGVELELFAWGRMPLAMSARCYTARAHRLPKDDCQFRCLDYPDGLTLNTQDDGAFLAINGIQTQSAASCNLLPLLDEARAAGVGALRLSPQSRGMERIVAAFDAVLHGGSVEDLASLAPREVCNGYWRGEAGMTSA